MRKWTQESFLEKIKELHGDNYLYDKVDFKSIVHPVIVICPVHGELIRIPHSLLKGCKCIFCMREERKSNKMKALCHPDKKHHAKNLCKDCYHLKYVDSRAKRNKGGDNSKFFSYIKIKYGINREEYNKIYEDSGGLCAICKNPPHENKRLHLDHCHNTGKIRGFLCPSCNWYLHKVENNPNILQTIKFYLGI